MGIPLQTANTVTGAPPAHDLATEVVIGTFTASGVSASWAFYGWFNVALWGTWSATVVVNKSYDGGTTWIQTTYPQTAVPVSLTTGISITLFEPEKGVLYQLSNTFTSGTVSYRMSANGRMAMSEGF